MPDEHFKWMRKAVDLASLSVPEEGRNDPSPAVGVVIVKDGVELASAYRGQCAAGNHAEKCALESLSENDVKGAVVYTTLEPCSRRNLPKIACAGRLIKAGVGTVYIGLYDPNPKIYREGWKMLRDAGIVLRDFPADLREELRGINYEFLNQYRANDNNMGKVTFDYVHSPLFTLGKYPLVIETRWSHANSKVIHAQAESGQITLARYAKSFEEIDDPSALDFDPHKYTVTVDEGNIVIFRGPRPNIFAIVMVEQVLSLARGDDRNEVTFSYEIRMVDIKGPLDRLMHLE